MDKEFELEPRSKQAFNMRQDNKKNNRSMMMDLEAARKLDEMEPLVLFEKLLKRKMEHNHMSYEQALEDIIRTASITRDSVNKTLGVK